MSRALLDINVLLALLDSDHIEHLAAREWLDREIGHGWASCAITENGFVRVLSQPSYPSPVHPRHALDLLARATRNEHHEFWKCSVTLTDETVVDRSRLHGPRQVTDAYLLALAVANGGHFVTFDRSVPLSAVRGAEEKNLTIL